MPLFGQLSLFIMYGSTDYNDQPRFDWRSKHTVVAYKDALFVFGGDNGKSMLNDLLRYDVEEKSWGRAVTMGTPPAPRYHHTAVIHEDSMYVFGGYTGDIHSNSNLTNRNDLYEYQFKTGQWIMCKFGSGRCPVPRAAHGAAVFDSKMWIFAGYDGNARLNDMWNVKLSSSGPKEWLEVRQSGDIPPTCCNFASAVCDHNMYVFSGQSGAKITNKLFRFNFHQSQWTMISTDHILRGAPSPPDKRYGHTMTAYDNQLYVFGGAAGQTLPKDLHCFDIASQMWGVIDNSGDLHMPVGRLFHSAETVNDALYVFGGTVDNNVRSSEIFRFKFSTYPKCTLREDYGKLLETRQFADVDFVIGLAGAVIQAHAPLVAARSPYLRVRLLDARQNRAAGLEDTPLRVVIEGTNEEAFNRVLSYIYTDQISPITEADRLNSTEAVILMMDVYKLADNLQMPRLKELSARYLQTYIDLGNVLEALSYAYQLDIELMRELCIRYIVKEATYHEVVMSAQFEQLERHIIVELVRRRQAVIISPARHAQAQAAEQNYTGAIDYANSAQNEHTLENDLKTFLQGPAGQEFVDVHLVLDGEACGAHVAILAARGEFFCGMFRSFMPENRRVSVSIGDMVPSSEAFRSLLRYIYYGDVVMPPEDSLYLFQAPHYYGFTNNRLQAFCKENLENNVSVNNVLHILEAAHQIGAYDMKRHALDIIVDNYAEISKQPELEKLDKEHLLTIMKAVGKHQIKKNMRETVRTTGGRPTRPARTAALNLPSMPPRVRLSMRDNNFPRIPRVPRAGGFGAARADLGDGLARGGNEAGLNPDNGGDGNLLEGSGNEGEAAPAQPQQREDGEGDLGSGGN